MEKITSRENAKIKYACRLASSGAFRRSEGKFLAEGRKLCPELCRGAALETLFCTEAALEKCPELAGLPGEHYLVEDHVADKLADVGTHQGVFGIFRTPVHTLDEAKTGGRYLALERVQDPGNVGTLLRSAAAFGFDGVLLSDGCASVFAPKTLRASMGAAVRVPVMEVGAMPAAIAALRAKNITCLAAALYQSQQSSGSGAGSGGKRLVWPKPGPVTGSPPGNATAGCCPQCRRSGFPPGQSWGCAQCRCRRQWSLPSGPGPHCR